MLRRRASLPILLAVVLAALPACTPNVDLKQALEITDVTSGWFDAGVVAGKNKLVPSVTFRLKKKGPAEVDRVSVNALFRAADGKPSDLENDVFVQRVEFQGDHTAPVVLRAENGYTAEPPQSRAEMLKHTQFRDMRVQIHVKQGSAQWTDLGSIDIQRQVITH